MEFASSSSKKTKVYTLEKFDEFADIAEKNFKLNNFLILNSSEEMQIINQRFSKLI